MKICWLYKKLIAYRLDAADSEPGRLNDHLAHCQGCREFHGRQTRLMTSLADHAIAHVTSPPRFLHGKIMSALDRNVTSQTNTSGVFHLFRWLAIPAFSVFLVLISWRWHSASPSHDRASQVDGRSIALRDLGASVNDSSTGEQLLEWCKNLNQPLETELYLVAGDAQTALSSLSEKFLPQGSKTGNGF